MSGPPSAHLPRSAVELSLLNTLELRCDGEPVELPMSAKRLLAFLGLHRHPLLRVYVAGALWLDVPEERAFGSLRSSLWRLNRSGVDLVEARNGHLRLAPSVRVDFREGLALADRLIRSDGDARPAPADWSLLAGELLPDWYDDWVLVEREHFRQMGLHGLEALADQQLANGSPAVALQAALAAVAGEPLRESAHRVLIRVHLAEGNAGEAIRHYRFFARLLDDQLGLEPSPQLRALIASFERP